MEDRTPATAAFLPALRKGLLFHLGLILLTAALSGLAFWLGFRQSSATALVLLVLLGVVLLAPLLLLIYRIYALLRGRYQLDRDSLHLRWGLRVEEIPLLEFEWVRPAAELPIDLPAPRLSWPGALSGSVQVEDLGLVEFMASDPDRLLLVATPQKVFAISPSEPQVFLDALQEAFEMGSLARIPAQSVLPAVYLRQVWSDRVARWLLLAGLALSLLLVVGVSLAIAGRLNISLGFYPSGAPLPAVPAAQLLLLPLLGLMFYVIDLLFGLLYYRQSAYRFLAYLLWGGSILTSLLLLGAVLWIL